MPKVSVVVPVYNAGDYLRECMDSLARQTLRDIEIICVNDGSTDGSPEALRAYAARDSRVTVIDQENGGYGRAVNAGMDRATGEYVGIAEPDDYVALTMFEDLYDRAAAEDLDLVKADFYRFYTSAADETRTLKYTHLSQRKEDYGRVFRPAEEPESFFFVMNTWAGIYRRSFLEKHGIRHQETPGASFQDNGFWFQTFLYAERAMILDIPCYRVRRDNPNSSVRDPGKVYAMNKEYDYIRGILERDAAVWEKMKDVYWRQRIRNCNATLNRIAPKFREEYLETVGKEIRAGIAAGEIRREAYPPEDRELTEALLNKTYIPAPPEEDEAARLRRSASYRIGRAITCLPARVRDGLRGRTAGGGKRK